jgi:NAD(P)-dependent dehydrogenase (short-subunit alcohol dehydrogenase family)
MATGSDTRELAGYRALVTGGTQGIGAAVAARLREAGATVLTTARKRPDALASDRLFVAADVAKDSTRNCPRKYHQSAFNLPPSRLSETPVM